MGYTSSTLVLGAISQRKKTVPYGLCPRNKDIPFLVNSAKRYFIFIGLWPISSSLGAVFRGKTLSNKRHLHWEFTRPLVRQGTCTGPTKTSPCGRKSFRRHLGLSESNARQQRPTAKAVTAVCPLPREEEGKPRRHGLREGGPPRRGGPGKSGPRPDAKEGMSLCPPAHGGSGRGGARPCWHSGVWHSFSQLERSALQAGNQISTTSDRKAYVSAKAS